MGKMKDSKYLQEDYAGEPMPAELINGPVENRKCTDFLCCIIFFVFLVTWGICGYAGFVEGNPKLLTYPFDHGGNQCGVPDTKLEDYKFIYYPFPITGCLKYSVCVKECPSSSSSSIDCFENDIYSDCGFSGINEEGCNYPVITGKYSTKGYIDRVCLPDSDQTEELFQSALSSVNSAIDLDTIAEWIGDVWLASDVIYYVAGITLLLLFLYMFLLRLCVGVIIWISIVFTFAALLTIAIFFHWSSVNQYKEENDEDTQETLYWISIGFYVLTGVFFLYILFMVNRIRLAIAIMKTGTRFIVSVWYALFVPPVIFVITGAVFAYWVFACIYLYSSGDISQENQDSFAEVSKTNNYKYMFYFEFWGILWVSSYLIATTQFILAGSVCIWYFSQGADSGPQRPVSRPIWWSIRYHMGSLAFGSLILAVVWTIKWILIYIRVKIKLARFDENNFFIGILLKCLTCFILCFERFIKFLNKNAYIQIALHSVSFCAGARDAFFLIFRNAARFLTLGSLGAIFIFLGKWLVTLSATYIGYLILTRSEKYENELHSPVFPTIVFLILAYVISSLFLVVYEMACDSILHCFLADEELMKSDGNREPEHAPSDLKDFLHKERDNDKITCCCG